MPITNFTDILQSLDLEGPVDMVNEISFRDIAHYPDPSAEPERTGREAFAEYGRLLDPLLGKIGGTINIWRGKVHFETTTDGNNTWDQIMIVRFPSSKAIVSLLSSPEYAQIHKHRAAALRDSRTYICTSSQADAG